ncbi:MAG: 50S ribosomal protein L29 [Planctomycetota bacterium]
MSKRKKELEELRGTAPEDLSKNLTDLEEQMFKLRYSAIAESLENSQKIRAARKRIARVKTVLHERAAAAAKAGE